MLQLLVTLKVKILHTKREISFVQRVVDGIKQFIIRILVVQFFMKITVIGPDGGQHRNYVQ